MDRKKINLIIFILLIIFLNVKEVYSICRIKNPKVKKALEIFKKAQEEYSQNNFKKAEALLIKAINLVDNGFKRTLKVKLECVIPIINKNYETTQIMEYYPKRLLKKLKLEHPPKIFVIIEKSFKGLRISIYNLNKTFSPREFSKYISRLDNYEIFLTNKFQLKKIKCKKIPAGSVCEKKINWIGKIELISNKEEVGIKLFNVVIEKEKNK